MEQKRIKEILDKSKTDKDLFNWCEEYKEWINKEVLYCVSVEWDYMLKKSYEDSESPVNYEDLEINPSEEDIKERMKYNAGDDYTNEEIEEEFENESGLYETAKQELQDETEVYEWWLVNDSLSYRLKQLGEIFLNGAWGRQTTGQSISLDHVCIKSFLDMLEDWKHYED